VKSESTKCRTLRLPRRISAKYARVSITHHRIKRGKLSRVRRGKINLLQFQPLIRKSKSEARTFGVGLHSLNLLSKHTRLPQFSRSSQISQFLIRQANPERITDTGGDCMIVQAAWRFDKGEKSRRTKDGSITGPQSLQQGVALGQ